MMTDLKDIVYYGIGFLVLSFSYFNYFSPAALQDTCGYRYYNSNRSYNRVYDTKRVYGACHICKQ